MLLPWVFWKDLCCCSKEMFVEQFILWNRWKTRSLECCFIMTLTAVILALSKIVTKTSLTQDLWMWLLFSTMLFLGVESITICECVFNKMKNKQSLRLGLKNHFKFAHAA